MNLLKLLMVATTLLFFTILVAVAVPDKADLGPFVATFDLGVPAGSYQIEINPPTQSQSYNSYWFRVRANNNELGRISLMYILTIMAKLLMSPLSN